MSHQSSTRSAYRVSHLDASPCGTSTANHTRPASISPCAQRPSGRRIARVAAGKGPTHGVPVGTGQILVADTRGQQLLLFGVTPLRQIGRLSLTGTPYGMAVDRETDTVWITLTARNEVVGVRVDGDRLRVIARYPTVRQPNTVAVSPGSRDLWITGTRDYGSLSMPLAGDEAAT